MKAVKIKDSSRNAAKNNKIPKVSNNPKCFIYITSPLLTYL